MLDSVLSVICRTLTADADLDLLAPRAAAITAEVSRARGLGEVLAWRAPELTAATTSDVPDVVHRWVLMSDGDRDVAAVELEGSLATDGPPDCEIWIDPDPDVAEIMTAGVAVGRQFARELGRDSVLAWVMHEEVEDRLASPAGAGDVGRDAMAEWLLETGARLAQVYRISAVDPAEVESPTGVADGYELVSWLGITPPEKLAAVALLHTTTLADAPAGETGYVPEPFTAARVAAGDTAQAASGRELVTVLALTADGEPAGISQAAVTLGLGSAWQLDTSVIAAHRGHGLGKALKTRLAAEIRQAHPEVELVVTFNAAENSQMLAINEELGWQPIAHKGVWVLPV